MAKKTYTRTAAEIYRQLKHTGVGTAVKGRTRINSGTVTWYHVLPCGWDDYTYTITARMEKDSGLLNWPWRAADRWEWFDHCDGYWQEKEATTVFTGSKIACCRLAAKLSQLAD